MLYTPELIELLNSHSIAISEAEREAHELALEEGRLSSVPFYFTSYPNSKKLSLYNIPGIGPSIELCGTERKGRHGSVSKHLTSTGKTFGLKTIKINSDEDLKSFKQEHDALKKRKLLEGAKHPENVGDVGLLAFPFYEGVSLRHYLKKHGHNIDPYKINYLLLSKVKEVHADDLVHGSPHIRNFKVEDGTDGPVVHLVDYGRSKPIDHERKKPYAPDMIHLGETFDEVFGEYQFSNNSNEHSIIDALSGWMSQAATLSMTFVENTLKFAQYLSGSGTLDNRTKIELLDFLNLAIFLDDVKIFKTIVNEVRKNYGDGALNEKNSEGSCIKSELTIHYKQSNKACFKEMLSFMEKEVPTFSSNSPKVVSLSGNPSKLDSMLERLQRKFRFLK